MSRIPFVSDATQRFVRQNPEHILREPERNALSQFERTLLRAPLIKVPSHIQDFGPWLGATASGPDRPDIVVTGICRGRTDEENAKLQKHGPLVEYLCCLDLASAVASHFNAQLHVWLLDQEAANSAISRKHNFEECLLVAEMMAEFVTSLFPNAQIFRSSLPEIRADLYQIVANTTLTNLYPRGANMPFGVEKPTLWESLEYLTCIAFLLRAADKGQRIWGVFDHDQIRPSAVASSLCPGIKCLFYWPVPSLTWRPMLNQKPVTELEAIREVPRRMYRTRNAGAMLCCREPAADILARLETLASQGQLQEMALKEIIGYLDPTCDSNNNSMSDLIESVVDVLTARLELNVNR